MKDKELREKITHVIGEYGAFNHMGVAEGNTVVNGIIALFQTELEKRELKKDIRYLTLKARWQRMYLGGEDDALLTKKRAKLLKQRLAVLTQPKESTDE